MCRLPAVIIPQTQSIFRKGGGAYCSSDKMWGKPAKKQENGLRLRNYYSTNKKNTFFKILELTFLKTFSLLKKNDKNRFEA